MRAFSAPLFGFFPIVASPKGTFKAGSGFSELENLDGSLGLRFKIAAAVI